MVVNSYFGGNFPGGTNKKGNRERFRNDGTRLAELWAKSVKAEYNTLYNSYVRKYITSGDEESLSAEPAEPAEEKTFPGPIRGRR